MITGIVSNFSSVVEWKMASIQLLLFDFDGVLVDSESFYEDLWKNLLDPLHLCFEPNNLTGKTNKQFLSRFNLSELEIEYLLKLKTDAELQYFENKLMEPALLTLLKKLKTHYKLAIVSNNRWANIHACLLLNNCAQYFEKIISIENGLSVKPAPDAYLSAIAHFNIDKKQALIVEDSSIGFESAKNAGVDFLVFSYQTLKYSLHSIESALGIKITN